MQTLSLHSMAGEGKRSEKSFPCHKTISLMPNRSTVLMFSSSMQKHPSCRESYHVVLKPSLPERPVANVLPNVSVPARLAARVWTSDGLPDSLVLRDVDNGAVAVVFWGRGGGGGFRSRLAWLFGFVIGGALLVVVLVILLFDWGWSCGGLRGGLLRGGGSRGGSLVFGLLWCSGRSFRSWGRLLWLRSWRGSRSS